MFPAHRCRLVQSDFITYKTIDELVVYAKLSKQTILLPIVAEDILTQLQQSFPEWCYLSAEQQDNNESVKNVVTLLVRAGLIESTE